MGSLEGTDGLDNRRHLFFGLSAGWGRITVPGTLNNHRQESYHSSSVKSCSGKKRRVEGGSKKIQKIQ